MTEKMGRVYKYPLHKTTGRQSVRLPAGAKVLSVGHVAGELVLWALVNPELPVDDRRWFEVLFTGAEFPLYGGKFIGTVVVDTPTMQLVLHVFEVWPTEPKEG